MGHYRPEGSYNAIILNSPTASAQCTPPSGQAVCEPAAAWRLYIGESSTPQTPWDPPDEGTGRTSPSHIPKPIPSPEGWPPCVQCRQGFGDDLELLPLSGDRFKK